MARPRETGGMRKAEAHSSSEADFQELEWNRKGGRCAFPCEISRSNRVKPWCFEGAHVRVHQAELLAGSKLRALPCHVLVSQSPKHILGRLCLCELSACWQVVNHKRRTTQGEAAWEVVLLERIVFAKNMLPHLGLSGCAHTQTHTKITHHATEAELQDELLTSSSETQRAAIKSFLMVVGDTSGSTSAFSSSCSDVIAKSHGVAMH